MIYRGRLNPIAWGTILRLQVYKREGILQGKEGPFHNPVTWYGLKYAGTQTKQWDFPEQRNSYQSRQFFFFIIWFDNVNRPP